MGPGVWEEKLRLHGGGGGPPVVEGEATWQGFSWAAEDMCAGCVSESV